MSEQETRPPSRAPGAPVSASSDAAPDVPDFTSASDAAPADAAPFPAFKEWAAVIAALGAGAQTIILRKGGIAEGRGGFDPARARRFWLHPTAFHAQREKLLPAAARFFPVAPPPAVPEAFEFFAELSDHRFIGDWPTLAALAPFHLWTETAVRERFEWARPEGVHLLVVRVRRLVAPVPLPPGVDVGGCKSWIELPLGDPAARPSAPVLDEETFGRMRAEVLRAADAR